MLNFEIKTKISNYTKLLEKVKKIGAVYKETINQIDYYFQTGTHKEKIREIDNKIVEYISYDRPEKKGRKDSKYIVKTISPYQKDLLLKQKKLVCVVNKTRELWIYKNTRIHLDNVVGLGNYIELETVVKDISKNQGVCEFKEVMNKLKIESKKSEPFSYSNLIIGSMH